MVQTYNTSLLYLLLSKPTFHSVYLRDEGPSPDARGASGPIWRYYKWAGQLALSLSIVLGVALIRRGGVGVYMGLILIWACPFLLLLWYGLRTSRLLPGMTDRKQEPCIPVHRWPSQLEHHPAHPRADIVPLDCRYLGIETGYMGDRGWHEAGRPRVAPSGD